MIAPLILLLFSCTQPDPMKQRAENAALVCYDNGTMVYASETTVDELIPLMKQQKECVAAKMKDCGGRARFVPVTSKNYTIFNDKGVKFESQTLDCVARVPDIGD